MVSFQTILDNFQFLSESGAGGSWWARFNTSESAMYVAILMGVVFSAVQYGVESVSIVILASAVASLMRETIRSSMLGVVQKYIQSIVILSFYCCATPRFYSRDLMERTRIEIASSLCAFERGFSSIGFVHLALFPRLVPTPILSRA